MTELKPRPVHPSTVKKVTLVETQLEGVYVIEAKVLWQDFRNRMKINNYEVKALFNQSKELFNQTKELINKATNK